MTAMIVDANAMFARSWYAAEHQGQPPMEAVSFMLRTLLLLLNPDVDKIGAYFDATLFAWDQRQNGLKDRREKPPVYHRTKARVQEAVEAVFGTANYEHHDYEGDDVVATAVYAAARTDQIYVVSADKDLQQLQGPRVHYYCLANKAILSRDYIIRKWHVKRPLQIALALAVIGDQVDNIKGVSGWGPAKAKKLFEAVTPEMDFEQAMNALLDQMPADKQAEFMSALDRTLLKSDVPGVPRPARLRLASPAKVNSLAIPGITGLYRQLFSTYRPRG